MNNICLKSGQRYIINKIFNLTNNIIDAEIESKIILTKVINKSYAHVIAYPEKKLTQNQLKKINNILNKRIKLPLAYILEEIEFYNLKFKTTKNTLIPRSETEQIIDIVKSLNLPQEKKIKILDLGTGTGCIGITLANIFNKWNILGVDICDKALNVAKYNAKQNKTNNYSLKQSNWFDEISSKQQFELIIANPPYIDKKQQNLLNLADPKLALFSKNSGYAELFKIIENSQKYLKSNGYLILEHGYNQANKIKEKLLYSDFSSIKIFKDHAGLDRITIAKIKNNLVFSY